jgi:AraC-like DNA-binding protein
MPREVAPRLAHAIFRLAEYTLRDQPLFELPAVNAHVRAAERTAGRALALMIASGGAVSLKEVAIDLSRSRFEVSRDVHVATGKPFRHHAAGIRVLHLITALSSEADIGPISARCGYAQPSSAVRAVRQWIGVTPSQFRSLLECHASETEPRVFTSPAQIKHVQPETS